MANARAAALYFARKRRRQRSVIAWEEGQDILVSMQRKNAGHLYCASTEGVSGASAPTHTEGTVSDGGVDWTFVSVFP